MNCAFKFYLNYDYKPRATSTLDSLVLQKTKKNNFSAKALVHVLFNSF